MPTACPWTTRVWKEFRTGNLTRSYRDVLLTLRTFQGSRGLCVPSHATLADRAKCCIRTVQRALRQADDLGLVRWVERRVRASWRWLRTSNQYLFMIPETPLIQGLRLPRRTTGQGVRGGESKSKKEALKEMLEAAKGLPDLLAQRRRMIEAQFRTQ